MIITSWIFRGHEISQHQPPTMHLNFRHQITQNYQQHIIKFWATTPYGCIFMTPYKCFFDPKSFAPETCGLLTAKLRKHVVQVSDFHLGGYLDAVVEKIATRGFCKQLCKTKWIGFSLHLICFWLACNLTWEPPCNTLQGQPTKKFMKNVNYTLWHEHLRLYATRLSLFIPKLNNKKRHFC